MEFIVAANWKMNKAPREVEPFFADFSKRTSPQSSTTICFFPPALLASEVARVIGSRFSWGGQNFYFETSGAFTGENSPQTLLDMGATWALVGHSERRSLFSEDDTLLTKKLEAAQNLGLRPIFCIGENLKERDEGQTEKVIRRQLKDGLALSDPSKSLVIAYEPVWAIGTGRVASPEQIEESHGVIRDVVGPQVPILYGGSVNPKNCKQLSSVKNVDGFLVGGASLEPESFAAIANSRL